MFNVSPLTINIMLAIYCSSDPASFVGEQTWNSRAAKESRDWLSTNCLIEGNCATEKGRAWVSFICQTPLPIQTWVRPE